jgi:hypothetical protein
VDRTQNPSTSLPCPTAVRASTALKMKGQVGAVLHSYKEIVVEKSRPAAVVELNRRTLEYLIIPRALHF